MAVEFRAFVEPQQGASYADQLAVAQTAEYLGFAAFFRSDHFMAPGEAGAYPVDCSHSNTDRRDSPARIRSMASRSLLRPTLAGKRVHRGKVVGNGTWEAIITADQHRRLVAVSKALTTGPGPEAKHLGTGLVKCGKCDEGVRYRTVAKRRRHALYACPRGCASMVAELVDAELWRAVQRRLRNVNPGDYDSKNPEVVAAVQQIEQLEADLAKWKKKAIAGDVDADVYAAVEKDRKAKMNALRPRTATPAPLRLRPENWDGATLQERRNVVRVLLDARLTGRGQIDITPI